MQKENHGNVTRSVLAFTPGDDAGGALLRCEAMSPALIHTPLQDEWELEIHCKLYIPLQSRYSLSV